jgi:hypothetical protein
MDGFRFTPRATHRTGVKTRAIAFLCAMAMGLAAHASPQLVLPQPGGTLRGVVLDQSGTSAKQQATDVYIPAGTDAKLYFQIVTQGGTAVDLTGASVLLTVRHDPSDPSPMFSHMATIDTLVNGAGHFELTQADTLGFRGQYKYDVVVVWPDSTRSQVVPTSNWWVQTSVVNPADPITVLPNSPLVFSTDPRLAPAPGTPGNFIVDNVTSYISRKLQLGDLPTGIPNSNLATPTFALSVSGPLVGGGSAPIGNGLSLSCPSCITSGGSYSDPSWITALAGAKITGTVANATNATNATTATNFSGPLAGDVSGTQGATVLASVATPGTYGDAQQNFIGGAVLDAKGRITVLTTHAAQVVNVLDYGAVGNGSTDDRVAIQAAIDVLRDTGGVVYFPPRPNGSCYMVSSPGIAALATSLHPYNNIILQGAGAASCIKASGPIGDNGASGLALIRFQGRGGFDFSMTNVGVDHLRVSGFDTTTLAGPLILCVRTNGCTLSNSYLDTSSTEGFYVSSNNSDVNGVALNNHCTSVGGYGVSPANGPLSCYNVNTDNALIVHNFSDGAGECVEAVGAGGIVALNEFKNTASGVGNSSPGTCLKLQSTQPGTGWDVYGNRILFAGIGVQFSSLIGSQGDHRIDTNIFEHVNQAASITNNVPVAVTNNNVYDTYSGGTGSSAVFDHGSGSTAAVTYEHNIVIGGPTGTWATGWTLRDGARNDLVAYNYVNFSSNVGVNAAVFSVPSSTGAWNAQLVENVVVPGALGNTFPVYSWQGVGLNNSNFPGIYNGVTLSTLRPSVLRASAPPVIGVWSVGDKLINSTQTATGISYWECTTAGTGAGATWSPRYGTVVAGTGVTVTNNMVGLTSVGPGAGTYCGGNNYVNSLIVNAQGQLSGAVTCGAPATSGATTIYENGAGTQCSTGGVVQSQSFTIPAGTLASNGARVTVSWKDVKAANTNSTTANFVVNGSTTVTTETSTTSAQTFNQNINITRTSDTTYDFEQWGIRSPGTVLLAAGSGTVTSWTNNTVTTVLSYNACTANGDVNSNFYRVTLFP